MARAVKEYPLPSGDAAEFYLHLPLGAELVGLTKRLGRPAMFVVVDLEQRETVKRYFAVFETGQPIGFGDWSHVGTWQGNHGQFVWHLFENTIYREDR